MGYRVGDTVRYDGEQCVVCGASVSKEGVSLHIVRSRNEPTTLHCGWAYATKSELDRGSSFKPPWVRFKAEY